MIEDIVRGYGYMTLGSRFKRIGERMQSDVARLLKTQGIEVPVALLPTLGALDRDGKLTVGELAESLGIAQPGVTRNLAQLETLNLIQSDRQARDQRLRSITLTEEGTRLVARMKQSLWPAIAQAVAEVCGDLRGPLLDQLTVIEVELERMPLDRRASLGGEA